MKCENCHKREATKKWLGDGGVLALVHGGGSDWCEVCVLKEQIKHAEERAAALPELRARLDKILFEELRSDPPVARPARTSYPRRNDDAQYNRPAEPGSPEYDYLHRYDSPDNQRDTMG